MKLYIREVSERLSPDNKPIPSAIWDHKAPSPWGPVVTGRAVVSRAIGPP